jgi:penicillin-binding protein 2
MVATVHGPSGTARGIGLTAPYLIGGKTGTAQVVSNKNNLRLDPHNLPLHLRHQALFIGYAPADAPRIAVAVVVEHGGFGSSSAAPVARAIMDAYLVPKRGSAPLPTAPPLPGASSTAPAPAPSSAPANPPPTPAAPAKPVAPPPPAATGAVKAAP